MWVDSGGVALAGVAGGVVEAACGSIPIGIDADGGCDGDIGRRRRQEVVPRAGVEGEFS